METARDGERLGVRETAKCADVRGEEAGGGEKNVSSRPQASLPHLATHGVTSNGPGES